MRLLHPNPGECIDRQTILALKIKYSGATEDAPTTYDTEMETSVGKVTRTIMEGGSKVNVAHFIAENEEIQKYLENAWFPQLNIDQGEDFDEFHEELAEVNHQLWKLTDQQHVLRDAPDKYQALANQRAAEVLFAIADLNDKRAAIVKKVNQLFNLNVTEKIFA